MSLDVLGMKPQTPVYFPHQDGTYSMAPRLSPFGRDYGNGVWDQTLFQFTPDFHLFRENILKTRREALSTYYCRDPQRPRDLWPVCRWMIERLIQESPQHFERQKKQGEPVTQLRCLLTGETISYDDRGQLVHVSSHPESASALPSPPYLDLFDALCSQVAEDLALTFLNEDGTDSLDVLHVMAPSSWSPFEKMSKSFVAVHNPVPRMDNINRNIGPLLKSLTHKGPFIRFNYSLTSNRILNPHRVANQLDSPVFSDTCNLIMRVERQTLWPFPELNAFLFTIRIHFLDFNTLAQNPQWAKQMAADVESMPDDVRRYKGIAEAAPEMIRWLRERVE